MPPPSESSEHDLRSQRLEPSPPDQRDQFQRDRDRILYTSAFQRLAEVTQVVGPDEGHVFHNRLTHSLKVAQVARRLAEKLIREQGELVESVGGLNADVAEAAALAHDLGHPPFGHLAEKTLNEELEERKELDGYEGNAQSFRIVTKLALRKQGSSGLNLTRATLNALLKYPWFRKTGPKDSKWGAYRSEEAEFLWARKMEAGEAKSVEAEIMDWADDVTYAIHDAFDFYCAGLVPLDRLTSSPAERQRFFDGTYSRRGAREALAEFSRSALSRCSTRWSSGLGSRIVIRVRPNNAAIAGR